MLASSNYNFLIVTIDKTFITLNFSPDIHNFESHMSNVTHLIPHKIFTHKKKIVDSVIFYLQMINQVKKVHLPIHIYIDS